MSTPISLRQFLINAAHGSPNLGLLDAPHLPSPSNRFEVRTIDAAEMTTLSGVFGAFARAWDFPESFGHNKDAFDDCMRDLDGPSLSAGTIAPAGYLTHITRAHNLLTSDLAQLTWFAEAMAFYGTHYNDIARPSATFAVVLSTSARRRDRVAARWHDAGTDLVPVD